MRQRVRRRTSLGLTFLVVVAVGFLLWPAQLGGGSTYVSTTGVSMEPSFRTGDLAVVRSADDYAVGDVAAYRSDMFDTAVMHRITAVEDGHYTLQGDNNSWLDPEQPTRNQLIGKLALRVPQGGVWLDRLTSPAALVLLVFALLIGGGTFTQTRRRRKRRTMSQRARKDLPSSPLAGLPPPLMTLTALAALMGVLGLALGVAAWAGPITRLVTTENDSEQSMTFSYSASVPRSAAYDGTTVTSPDPVFRKLTNTVEVRYSYRGEPGSIAVNAEISTASGWHSTVRLRPSAKFSDSPYTGTLRLDLTALEARAQAAAAATGIPASQIDIAVVPRVTTSPDTVFAPELRLALTALQLTLAGDQSSLVVRDATAVKTDKAADRTLNLVGLHLSVPTARTMSLILTLGALLAAALIALLARLRAPTSETAAIRRRYAQMLVQVEPMPTPAGRPVIDVIDFPTLAKLAERYELLVLHWSRSDVDTFVIQDQSVTYRYRSGTGSTAATGDVPAETIQPASDR